MTNELETFFVLYNIFNKTKGIAIAHFTSLANNLRSRTAKKYILPAFAKFFLYS